MRMWTYILDWKEGREKRIRMTRSIALPPSLPFFSHFIFLSSLIYLSLTNYAFSFLFYAVFKLYFSWCFLVLVHLKLYLIVSQWYFNFICIQSYAICKVGYKKNWCILFKILIKYINFLLTKLSIKWNIFLNKRSQSLKAN